MKFSWRLLAFGVIVYLAFLLITMPANIATARLQSRGIVASGVTGSVWNGKSAAMQIGNSALGAVEWHVNTTRLLAGKLNLDIRVRRDDGSLSGNISVGFGKRIELRSLQGAIPIAALGGMGFAGGWQGTLRLDLATVDLENNWPVDLRGTIDAANLAGPAYQPTQIGSYKVTFDGTKDGEGLPGQLISTGDGPFDVSGSVHLQPNRNYKIDALIATRPGTSESVTKALQYLGPPDAQGRRPFSMAGIL